MTTGRDPAEAVIGVDAVRLTRTLDDLLAARPVVLLHERKLPGDRGVVDHVAVGPAGVTVFHARRLHGPIRVERTGGLFDLANETLRVAGRERMDLVEGVERDVSAIGGLCGGVPVHGVLCLVDTSGLPLVGNLAVRDVVLTSPRRAARLAGRRGSLGPTEVAAVSAELGRRLRPNRRIALVRGHEITASVRGG